MYSIVVRVCSLFSALLILIGTSACASTSPTLTLNASSLAAPTPSVTESSIPVTAVPASTPEAPLATLIVMTRGHVGLQPRITAATALGQVCPGDEIVTLQRQCVEYELFLFMRVTRRGPDCGGPLVAVGTEGWIKSTLVGKDAPAVANAESTASPKLAASVVQSSTTPTIPTSAQSSLSATAIHGSGRIMFVPGRHYDTQYGRCLTPSSELLAS